MDYIFGFRGSSLLLRMILFLLKNKKFNLLLYNFNTIKYNRHISIFMEKEVVEWMRFITIPKDQG